LKFRFHRGGLEASMATLITGTPEEVCAQLASAGYTHICFAPYVDEPDLRIGWDRTYIVTGKMNNETTVGVVGFADCDCKHTLPERQP
jgi:hypothetical protein